MLVQTVNETSRFETNSWSHRNCDREFQTKTARTGNVTGCEELAEEKSLIASSMFLTCSHVYFPFPHVPVGQLVTHPILSKLEKRSADKIAENQQKNDKNTTLKKFICSRNFHTKNILKQNQQKRAEEDPGCKKLFPLHKVFVNLGGFQVLRHQKNPPSFSFRKNSCVMHAFRSVAENLS